MCLLFGEVLYFFGLLGCCVVGFLGSWILELLACFVSGLLGGLVVCWLLGCWGVGLLGCWVGGLVGWWIVELDCHDGGMFSIIPTRILLVWIPWSNAVLDLVVAQASHFSQSLQIRVVVCFLLTS